MRSLLWKAGTGCARREISACIVCGCSWVSLVQNDDYCDDGVGDVVIVDDGDDDNSNINNNNNGIIYPLD